MSTESEGDASSEDVRIEVLQRRTDAQAAEIQRLNAELAWFKERSELQGSENAQVKSIKELTKVQTTGDGDVAHGKTFVSYRGSCAYMTSGIVRRLRGQGYDLFFAGTDLERKADIIPALSNCSSLLVVLSEDYFESKWCLLELTYAFHTGKSLACCLLYDFPVGEFLEKWKRLATKETEEKHPFIDLDFFRQYLGPECGTYSSAVRVVRDAVIELDSTIALVIDSHDPVDRKRLAKLPGPINSTQPSHVASNTLTCAEKFKEPRLLRHWIAYEEKAASVNVVSDTIAHQDALPFMATYQMEYGAGVFWVNCASSSEDIATSVAQKIGGVSISSAREAWRRLGQRSQEKMKGLRWLVIISLPQYFVVEREKRNASNHAEVRGWEKLIQDALPPAGIDCGNGLVLFACAPGEIGQIQSALHRGSKTITLDFEIEKLSSKLVADAAHLEKQWFARDRTFDQSFASEDGPEDSPRTSNNLGTDGHSTDHCNKEKSGDNLTLSLNENDNTDRDICNFEYSAPAPIWHTVVACIIICTLIAACLPLYVAATIPKPSYVCPPNSATAGVCGMTKSFYILLLFALPLFIASVIAFCGGSFAATWTGARNSHRLASERVSGIKIKPYEEQLTIMEESGQSIEVSKASIRSVQIKSARISYKRKNDETVKEKFYFLQVESHEIHDDILELVTRRTNPTDLLSAHQAVALLNEYFNDRLVDTEPVQVAYYAPLHNGRVLVKEAACNFVVTLFLVGIVPLLLELFVSSVAKDGYYDKEGNLLPGPDSWYVRLHFWGWFAPLLSSFLALSIANAILRKDLHNKFFEKILARAQASPFSASILLRRHPDLARPLTVLRLPTSLVWSASLYQKSRRNLVVDYDGNKQVQVDLAFDEVLLDKEPLSLQRLTCEASSKSVAQGDSTICASFELLMGKTSMVRCHKSDSFCSFRQVKPVVQLLGLTNESADNLLAFTTGHSTEWLGNQILQPRIAVSAAEIKSIE